MHTTCRPFCLCTKVIRVRRHRLRSPVLPVPVPVPVLSIRLKTPARLPENDDLLSEVVAGIQAPLRGDYAQLDELLKDVCAARRAATRLLFAHVYTGATT
ncbi:hypothetical protein QBC39DRAFT_385424 [Podospora conica]|nr:hypothetical protein QBC39DRAFT_385424 [Schizothecium conicum]